MPLIAVRIVVTISTMAFPFRLAAVRFFLLKKISNIILILVKTRMNCFLSIKGCTVIC